jgi:hypothetical protein
VAVQEEVQLKRMLHSVKQDLFFIYPCFQHSEPQAAAGVILELLSEGQKRVQKTRLAKISQMHLMPGKIDSPDQLGP